MRQVLEQVQAIEICTVCELKITTGDSNVTVFHKLEEALLEDELGYKEAIGKSYGDEETEYRSVIDLLFCEVMGEEWRAACRRYYLGTGDRLRDCQINGEPISSEQLDEWESVLLKVIYLLRHAQHMGIILNIRDIWQQDARN